MYTNRNLTRRELLRNASMGFGSVALSAMFQKQALAEKKAPDHTHFPAKAKSVIFMFMDGGVSQVDSFDPKPLLDKEHGQPPKFKTDATVFNAKGNLMASPWKFKRYGQSGIPISDLFPNLGTCADELCVIRSMTAFSANHPNAVYGIHTGHALLGWPSMGAWASYGLGSVNENLPGFVVLHGGITPNGGVPNFGSSFLPSTHSGTVLTPGKPMRNISRREASIESQARKLQRLNEIDGDLLGKLGHAPQVEAAIRNHELAFRMQMEVPAAMDLAGETDATKRAYGLEAKWENTQKFGTQCLLARRMVERGVRFIELTTSGGNGDRWDQHGNIKDGHEKNARSVDQPIAALIKDLKQRGLLESTLLVFAGEFGRTPFAQGNGRDHNPQGFSIWMAGGGASRGTIYGATDEYGYRVVENKLTVHDMHANMLHLLGIDHKRLTVRFSGRDMRLTDVHGKIVPEIVGG